MSTVRQKKNFDLFNRSWESKHLHKRFISMMNFIPKQCLFVYLFSLWKFKGLFCLEIWKISRCPMNFPLYTKLNKRWCISSDSQFLFKFSSQRNLWFTFAQVLKSTNAQGSIGTSANFHIPFIANCEVNACSCRYIIYAADSHRFLLIVKVPDLRERV